MKPIPTPDADHPPWRIWLSTEQAAEWLGLKEQTLRKWRMDNKENQPPYYRLTRCYKYNLDELMTWKKERPAHTK